jgi:uncharacterized repeat protein (TIGR01451 family)
MSVRTTMLGFVLAAAAVLSTSPAQAAPKLSSEFLPNLGQFDPRVAWQAEQAGVRVFVTSRAELVNELSDAQGRRWVLTERFGDALSGPVRALEPGTTDVAWIAGETRQGRSARHLDLGEAWPGIRVELTSTPAGFERLFQLAPRADVANIQVHMDGAEAVLVADGSLALSTGLGRLELSAPVAWQESPGGRREVEVAYRLLAPDRYGFALGAFDPALAVTIDPVLRSTFVGGNGEESMIALAAHGGSVYALGYARSANFPGTAGGFQPSIIRNSSLGGNVFLARYSEDLSTLRQATYFGRFEPIPGSGGQSGTLDQRSLAVSDAGVFIGGSAPGNGTHLPTTVGALQTTAQGGARDFFLARFSLDLTQLLAATYYGGSGDEYAWPIALAADGVYIAGNSASSSLPGTAGGAVPASPGVGALAVAKLSLDLSEVRAASWASGAGFGLTLYAMAIGTDGSVYLGGEGNGSLLNTVGAFQPAPGQGSTVLTDGFIIRFSGDLSVLHRSTYLGGNANDRLDVLVDSAAGLYAAGGSNSSNFPTTPDAAFPTANTGNSFVALLNPDLSTRIAATRYGSSNNSTSTGGLIVDAEAVVLAGTTNVTTLPGTAGGAQPSSPGGTCGFAARFSPALTTLEQATYLGCGSNTLQVFAAARGENTYFFGGRTQANVLPATDGAAQPNNAGNWDGFIISATGDLGGPRPTSDLSLLKTGSTERIDNRYVLYTVTVSNAGPDAAVDARIQDALPPELDALRWTCTALGGAACPGASGSATLDVLATLPAGGQLQFSLCARAVNAAEQITNTATATVANGALDPVPSNNSASWSLSDPRLFADGFEDRVILPLCAGL